jgi:carbon-monoxide dehydrogenase iron sulfur subunit
MTQDHGPYIKTIPRNCSGCRLCELVCSDSHHPGLVNPRKARVRVDIEHRENKNHPRVCIQCADHPCLESCPVEAIQIDPSLKIPVVGKEACTGCRACVEACPYRVMFFDEDENFALKCDLCGGDPECVKNCAMGAIVLETSG